MYAYFLKMQTNSANLQDHLNVIWSQGVKLLQSIMYKYLNSNGYIVKTLSSFFKTVAKREKQIQNVGNEAERL